MQKFLSDGVEIAYEIWGQGAPILLVHGFASNARVNWLDTGWVKFLTDNGRMVIGLDNRGHGESEKLYESAVYQPETMALDCLNLLDHLQIGQVDVMGYSMGARISATLTLEAPERVNRLILAGLAMNLIHGIPGTTEIAAALLAESKLSVTDMKARTFRMFAESTGSDLKALAACIVSSRKNLTSANLSHITAETLVVAGENDEVSGSVDELCAILPHARGLVLPRKNHMNAVGDMAYKQGVLEFLGR